jgi:hypothetical protein
MQVCTLQVNTRYFYIFSLALVDNWKVRCDNDGETKLIWEFAREWNETYNMVYCPILFYGCLFVLFMYAGPFWTRASFGKKHY